MKKRGIMLIILAGILASICACGLSEPTTSAKEEQVEVSEEAVEDSDRMKGVLASGGGRLVTSREIALPHKDMPEKELSDTSLGTAYYYGDESVTVKNGERKSAQVYYYYEKDSIIYVVRVVDGRIYDITDYRKNPWNRSKVYKDHPYIKKDEPKEKTQDTNSTPKQNTGVSSEKKHPYNPYDVYEFDDPDDFADEWADEFGDGDYDEGWDEAWDYWQDHHD